MTKNKFWKGSTFFVFFFIRSDPYRWWSSWSSTSWSGGLDDEEAGELDQEEVLWSSSSSSAWFCWSSVDARESRSSSEWLWGLSGKKVSRLDYKYTSTTKNRKHTTRYPKVPSREERSQVGIGSMWSAPGSHLVGSARLQQTSFRIVTLFFSS